MNEADKDRQKFNDSKERWGSDETRILLEQERDQARRLLRAAVSDPAKVMQLGLILGLNWIESVRAELVEGGE